jgi:hypothetical protein
VHVVFVNPLDREIAEEKAAGLARTEERLLAALATYRGGARGPRA